MLQYKNLVHRIYKVILYMIKYLYNEAKNIKEKDPAAKNLFEVILLYPRFSYFDFLQNSSFFL